MRDPRFSGHVQPSSFASLCVLQQMSKLVRDIGEMIRLATLAEVRRKHAGLRGLCLVKGYDAYVRRNSVDQMATST